MNSEAAARTISLKIDVCTRQGLDRGVPRLLDALARRRLRASFFLAFGPDQSGRAILNVLQPGFLKKMWRSGAPKLYGWKTLLRGTLLPAPLIAAGRPDLVRRIADAGHDVALHGFAHRRWQAHLARMSEAEIRDELRRGLAACHAILGRAPSAIGAPAWLVTATSLRLQEELGLPCASDLRGGEPCRLRVGDHVLRTPQIPTTGPCIEELLAVGVQDEAALEQALIERCLGSPVSVLAVHAEVEGGPYLALFERLLARLADRGDEVLPLSEVARRLDPATLPIRTLALVRLPGRSGQVATAVTPGATPS